ncbi:hypothetical protein [Xanthobacter versatilis]|uniref:hypothetical protein n=1 Tax=Xanthobacter autotrophicus (strain ATCC BAA-1158 / Py2) TaxID=78245 RepID=UPI00372BC7CA
MTLRIDYKSNSFPSTYTVGSGTLETNWNELLWAAITIGRPSAYHVFRHGPASFHEAIFRLSLLRMAVEEGWDGYLRRTDAFAALDPTEKGMVSYFLGMVLCKLFASRLLHAPWLLHLDVFRSHLSPIILGRSRPDLVGEDISGKWHAFESKGRSSSPTYADKMKAKGQANRLVSVGGIRCSLHIGSFAFFHDDVLNFYWRDPEPISKEKIELPAPEGEWRYYFEPALRLAEPLESELLAGERAMADVEVDIHPVVRKFLEEGDWLSAQKAASGLRQELEIGGYHPDGIRVTAGESWAERFVSRARG